MLYIQVYITLASFPGSPLALTLTLKLWHAKIKEYDTG